MDEYKSEGLFSSKVMDAIDALIVVLDVKGNVVFTNTACEEITGYKTQDVRGRPVWHSFIVPEEVEETKAVFSRLVLSEENNRHENYWKSKNGERRLISWSNTCLHNDQGALEYVVATGIDVTQRRKDQRSLKEREAKYQAIISSAPDCIISIDESGTVDEVNSALEKIFGYKPSELIGKNVSILMAEPYRSNHNAYLSNYLKTGQKKIIGSGREVEGIHKDGNTIPIYISVNEIRTRNKRLFIGIIHDLTNLRLQEESLKKAHKIEALGQLTGGIAHDFNNLLTIILGNLEILENKKMGPDVSEILDEVFDVVGQGTSLVSQLLAFGRRQSLNPKKIIVNDIVRQMTKLLSRTFREDIEIETRLPRNIWACHVDPDQLESALLNVVLNARDAMPNGGKITISTANVSSNNKNIADDISLVAGDYIEIILTDTEKGIPRAVLSKVFDPFFTTKGVGMGTGLGLSMVHGFVEQSNGRLGIDSIEGEGTTVSIYLPRYRGGEDSEIHEDRITSGHDGDGAKVLHIEDDPKVRQINTRRLTALGYTVLTAKDAPTGLEILSNNEDIKIVFSDIVMPGGMNGFALAKKIKDTYPQMKILLTTGYSDDILSEESNGFIILKKPFSKEQLAVKLKEVLLN